MLRDGHHIKDGSAAPLPIGYAYAIGDGACIHGRYNCIAGYASHWLWIYRVSALA